jgi:hypothetical protein
MDQRSDADNADNISEKFIYVSSSIPLKKIPLAEIGAKVIFTFANSKAFNMSYEYLIGGEDG